MSDSRPVAQTGEQAGAISLLRRIFAEHGRRHILAYVGAAVFMALGAGATALCAWLLKPILNQMVEGEAFKELRALAWAVFGLFALRGAATFGAQVLLARAGTRMVAEVQNRLYNHLLRQDMRFFHDRHSSEFMTRLAIAANGVRDAMQVSTTSISRDVLTAAGLIAVMILQDAFLAHRDLPTRHLHQS